MINLDITKTVEIAEIYDYYKSLLTEKQRLYFEMYFFEDLTLQEIGQEYGISRNAIYDSISKTVTLLNDFETKLNLKKKSNTLKKLADGFKNGVIEKDQFLLELEKEL